MEPQIGKVLPDQQKAWEILHKSILASARSVLQKTIEVVGHFADFRQQAMGVFREFAGVSKIGRIGQQERQIYLTTAPSSGLARSAYS